MPVSPRYLFVTCFAVTWVACGGGALELGLDTPDPHQESEAALLGGDPVLPGEFSATGFINSAGVPGRGCSAVRIADGIGLTAGHCMGTNGPGVYQFGWGEHTLKGAQTRAVLRSHHLSNSDLTIFEFDRCGIAPSGPPASVFDHRGLTKEYVIGSYLHENNTRDGAKRKIDALQLTQAGGSSLTTTMSCSYASIWGGDSGSPLYNRQGMQMGAARAQHTQVIGIATSVSNFCQSGATTQKTYYVYLAAPAVRQQIEQKLKEWQVARVTACAPAAADAAE